MFTASFSQGGAAIYPVSAPYLAATQGSHRQSVQIDAWYAGAPIFGADNLLLESGTITDSSTPGVRRQVDVTLTPRAGLFNRLAPNGAELRVRSILRYPNGVTESIPMGVFDIASVDEPNGPGGVIVVRGDDKWVKIQRAKFLRPKASWEGLRITTQITSLIREVFGPSEPVAVLTSNASTVGTLVWEQDRDKAIIELADSIGCWVYADRDGIFTIADLPTGNPGAAVWTVDAGSDGILLDVSRSRDRSSTFNVVVVATEKADGVPPWDPVIVWDNDPSSPTYAGSDPEVGTQATPFGVAPTFWTSQAVEDPGQAEVAGLAQLTRVRGLNAQLSLSAVRNHALDSLDSIAVVLPREGYGATPVTEHHLIDKVVHPMVPDGEQSIETRSTRTDVP
jgi:hypothetical protein